MLKDFIKIVFIGNSIENYCWFLGIILAGLIFQHLLSKLLTLFVFKVLQKYSIDIGYDKMLALLKKPMRIFILLIVFYLAFDRLEFPSSWNLLTIEKFGLRMLLYRSFQIALVISITWIFLRIIDFFGLVLTHRASLIQSKTDNHFVPFIKETIKVIVIIFSIFFLLGAIFELNVASLIAGLGIGGLAIALAAKESLENLIGSFAIFLDKPFVIGDTIKIAGIEGQVENIGFRSTRIRTLEKSLVTIPNKKLVDNELDNLSHRKERRVNFNIGLSFETKPDQFKNIITDIQKIIENHPHVSKNETQVRLNSFDSNSINIMILYFVDGLGLNMHLDIREEINYKIIEIVGKYGAVFAFSGAPGVTINK
jgi:MscS family membrane protein